MSRRAVPFLLLLALVGGVSAARADQTTYIRPIQKEIPAAGVTQVVITNLVGPVSIQTTDQPNVSLTILIHAAGADQTFARTLAGQLNFSIQQITSQLRVTGVYPLDHFRDYGYPYMKSVLGIHGTDTTTYNGKKVFIRAAGSNKAVVLWAEIRLTLPARISVYIRNQYGDVALRGGGGPESPATLDGFTDDGDFTVYRPRWQKMKLVSNYGKVEFTDGLGVGQDIHVTTGYCGAFIALPPGQNGKIVAHKDLGFLHNQFNNASFTKNENGDSVMQLGNGAGPTLHVDMNVGSLHLQPIGAGN